VLLRFVQSSAPMALYSLRFFSIPQEDVYEKCPLLTLRKNIQFRPPPFLSASASLRQLLAPIAFEFARLCRRAFERSRRQRRHSLRRNLSGAILRNYRGASRGNKVRNRISAFGPMWRALITPFSPRQTHVLKFVQRFPPLRLSCTYVYIAFLRVRPGAARHTARSIHGRTFRISGGSSP